MAKFEKYKIAKISGIILALFLIVIAALPLLVPLEKYHSQIETLLSEKINGTVKLGKLSLTFWGAATLSADSLLVKDQSGHDVLSTKNANFSLLFSSIFKFSPAFEVKIIEPTLSFRKNRSGIWNFTTLLVTQSANSAPTTSPTPENKSSQAAPGIPKLILAARLILTVKNATVSTFDEVTNKNSQASQIDIKINPLSLTEESYMSVSMNILLPTSEAALSVYGPMQMQLHIKPQWNQSIFTAAEVLAKIDCSSMTIRSGEFLNKQPGTSLTLDTKIVASPKEIKMASMNLILDQLSMTMAGHYELSSKLFSLDVTLTDSSIQSVSHIFPAVAANKINGKLDVTARLQSKDDKLDYQAHIELKNVQAKQHENTGDPSFGLIADIYPDKVSISKLAIDSKNNHILGSGKITSFSKPKLDFKIVSEGINLDEWLAIQKDGTTSKAVQVEAKHSPENTKDLAPSPASSIDALLKSYKKNPYFKNSTANITMQLPFFIYLKTRYAKISASLNWANAQLNSRFDIASLFDGTLKTNFSGNLNPDIPTYQLQINVDNIDIKKAVESQFEAFRNTVYGKLSFNVSGEGKSFDKQLAIKNLTATGNFKIDQATFASIDISKILYGQIQNQIGSLNQIIPSMKPVKLGEPSNYSTEYDFMSANFRFEDSNFKTDTFVAKAKPNRGFDLTGVINVTQTTRALEASWKLIDTYDISRAKTLNVDIAGTVVPAILVEPGQSFTVPLKIAGTLDAPLFKTEATLEALAKIASKNIERAAEKRAKDEAGKLVQKAQQDFEKNTAPQLKKGLESLGKKLFGR